MPGRFLAISLLVLLAQPSRGAAQSATEVQAPGDGDRDAEARALFEAGEVAFREGRYENALEYLERSYELSQRPALLYNIGTTYDRLRRDEQALSAFERYLEARPDAQNRAEVERRIAVLREAIARGAQSPPAETGPAETGPTERPPPETAPNDPVPGAVTAGVGGAVMVAGAVLLGLAAADVAAVEGAPLDAPWSSVSGAYGRSEAESIAGALLLGVGAVAVAAGVVWAVMPGEHAVELAPTAGGLVVRGTF